MELVDVVDSKSTAGDSVPVRVRSPAPKGKATQKGGFFFWYCVVTAQNRRFDPRRPKNASRRRRIFGRRSACSERSESLSGHRHQKKRNPCRGWAFFMSTEREPEVRVRGAGRAPPGADAARSASGSGQNFASKCAQEILGTATRTTGTKRKSHPKGWLFLLVLCGHSAEPAVRSAALQKCDTFWGYRIFYCSLGAYFVVFCRGACYYVKLGYCAFQTERNVWIWALSKL